MIELKLNRILIDGKVCDYYEFFKGESEETKKFFEQLDSGEKIIGLNSERYRDIYFFTKREFPKEVFNYLKTTPYFIAPASTCYHYNCIGGLLLHSFNVYDIYKKLNFCFADREYLPILLHDLGKAFIYLPNTEPYPLYGYKNSQKYWKPFIIYQKRLSVRDYTIYMVGLLQGLFPKKLNFGIEHIQAIALHDNNFEVNSQNICYNFSDISKLALEYQASDSLATKVEPIYNEESITKEIL